MIRALHLRNFKCFSDEKLRLAPLTLLSGLNGMGKSSVIQSLLILRQSYQQGILQQGLLATAGDLVDLGTVSDIWFERAKDESIEVRLELDKDIFSKTPREARFPFRVLRGESLGLYGDKASMETAINSVVEKTVLFADRHPSGISKFQYLNAERNGPRKYSPMLRSRASPGDLGARGEFALHILEMFQDSIRIDPADPRWMPSSGERLRDQIEVWLGDISPGVVLSIKPIPDADLMVSGFSFGAAGQLRSRDYRATNVGFGLSYVLPVLVALLAVPRGGLILIENPEAHLHPRGQTRLGELCARAAAAGVQVVIETHSDHVMDGARIAIREGVLDAKKAAFHYFERTNGEIDVVSPSIDAEGRLSEWPAGFFDQTRRNSARLVRPKL